MKRVGLDATAWDHHSVNWHRACLICLANDRFEAWWWLGLAIPVEEAA